MMLKKLILLAAASVALAGCAGMSAGSSSAAASPAVAAAAEKLRVAMIDPTPAALNALVADDLSYGHSGGKVDTKASFISDLMDKKSDFVTIAITDQ
ncbi:MAG: nuclear transport factor 2 family protein, partial [Comamonadaceae bacterium]